MNGDKLEISQRTGRLLLCVAATSLLGACAGLRSLEPYADAPVDPGSGAAAVVAAQAATPGPYPTFASIPRMPADLRTPEGWRMAVAGTEAEREALLRATAPSTFSLRDTEAFAQRIRAAIDVDPSDAPTAADAAATEAWAQRMRARATPPPRPR